MNVFKQNLLTKPQLANISNYQFNCNQVRNKQMTSQFLCKQTCYTFIFLQYSLTSHFPRLLSEHIKGPQITLQATIVSFFSFIFFQEVVFKLLFLKLIYLVLVSFKQKQSKGNLKVLFYLVRTINQTFSYKQMQNLFTIFQLSSPLQQAETNNSIQKTINILAA